MKFWNYTLILSFVKKKNIVFKIWNKKNTLIIHYRNETLSRNLLVIFILKTNFILIKKRSQHHNKILHLEWSKKDLDVRSERFYKKKKIQIVYWDELADNKEPILLLLKFLKSNFRWLTSIIFYDIQVTVQILTSIYLRYKSECKLKKFDKLKLILVCYDVLFLNEIAVACKKLKIATLSIQDRLISSSWSPSMIFDHYFVIGPKSKKILKR